MLRISTAAIAALLFTGCAAGPRHDPNHPGAASDDDNMICHEESTTGSNMSHTVCKPRNAKPADGRNDNRDDTENALGRPSGMTTKSR